MYKKSMFITVINRYILRRKSYMKIVMLCKAGISSAIVFEKLTQTYELEKVIIEAPVPKKTLLKNRIKKIGFLR